MKTAISIPDPLFEAGEAAAKRLGVSRSELYRRALRRYLDEHDGRTVTEVLDSVYGDRPGDSELDAVLESAQRASVASDEW